jgi:hypothetical protein
MVTTASVIKDKLSAAYIDHLTSIKNDAAAVKAGSTDDQQARRVQLKSAVKAGSADDQQARRVQLKAQTAREYADCNAFCRVNEQLDSEFFKDSIPDEYKGGLRNDQNRADILAERTQDKVEARRQAAAEAGIGSTILQPFEVAQIVTDLSTATVNQLSDLNMFYVGVTKYTIGSRGFNREVVRWAAVDGGCLPALTARDGSAPIMCNRTSAQQVLQSGAKSGCRHPTTPASHGRGCKKKKNGRPFTKGSSIILTQTPNPNRHLGSNQRPTP